jgi:hypothetical protein
MIRWWLTTKDLKPPLAAQPALAWQTGPAATGGERIEVDPAKTHQPMLGMGASLDPATCSNLWRMLAEESRPAVLCLALESARLDEEHGNDDRWRTVAAMA